MATVTIRNLDDVVVRGLKERAVANGRSMEAEARQILAEAVGSPSFVEAWLDLCNKYGGVELEVPARSMPREIDLS